MQPSIENLAKQLIECRGALQELEERQKAEREPYEQAKQAISEKLMAGMAEAKTLSTRFEDFTISRKKSVKAVVINEGLAVSTLEERGDGRYLETRLNARALKEVEKGSLVLNGVTVEMKEYVSIRQAKPEQANAA